MSSPSLSLALLHRPHSLCLNLPTIILLLVVLLSLPFPSPATPEWTYRFLFPSLLPGVRPGQRSRLLLLLALITCVAWRGSWEDLQLWEEKAESYGPGGPVSRHGLQLRGDQPPPAGLHHWTFDHVFTRGPSSQRPSGTCVLHHIPFLLATHQVLQPQRGVSFSLLPF